MSRVAAGGNLVLVLLAGTPANSWQEAGASRIPANWDLWLLSSRRKVKHQTNHLSVCLGASFRGQLLLQRRWLAHHDFPQG
jgi:hypothetical protein